MVREHIVLVVQPAQRDQMAAIASLLKGHDKVQGVDTGDDAVRVVLKADVEDYSDLPKLIIENGIALKQFTEEQLDLESAFMALTKGTSTRM